MIGLYLANDLIDIINILVVIAIGLLFILVCIVLPMSIILKSPFKYDAFRCEFDVSAKHNVKMKDFIDTFLCDAGNWEKVQLYERDLQHWKEEAEEYAKSCILRSLRIKQYHEELAKAEKYCFVAFRMQTRYRQRDYTKTKYKIKVVVRECPVSFKWLEIRHKRLEKIGFEATLREYNSKNQRKLMTPDLRRKIMKRDNYTCQICGKRMRDEVGLHIDHIIPIAKGGKSVESNLRVLCSKCNGRKGSK